MRSLVALLVCALVASPCLAQARRNLTAPPLVTTDRVDAPVRLERAAMSVEQAGGTVRTTLDMTFRNPSSRTLEGNLEFPLQPGQQVVAFALDIGGRLRSAVPVEKQRGRQVLEAIERRGADPGLLEQSQGEHFRLRIYPVAPGGERSVRIVLAEVLSAGATSASLPAAFVAGLDALPITVRANDTPRVEGALRTLAFARKGRGRYEAVLHPGDVGRAGALRLVLPAAIAPLAQVQTWRGERYFAADVPVALRAEPRALPQKMVLLWDSSASGAKRAHDLELALLDAYFHSTRAVDVDLVRFRDTVEPAQHFRVLTGDWSALRAALESTVYDGATRLNGWTPPADAGEVLLFSDGVFNFGDAAFPTFDARQRLYTVRAGVAGDAARLKALAEARAGVAITLDSMRDIERARSELLNDLPRIAAIDAIGARDVIADSTVVRDGMLRIAGRLTDADARVTVDVVRGGTHERVEVPVANAIEGESAAPLWAQYDVARLMEAPERNRAAIARVGADFGIVTPGSSLIVLENVADYVRYSIAPPDELREEYARLASAAATQRDEARVKQLDTVREQWKERVEWWSTSFPKGAPPVPKKMREPAVAAAVAYAPPPAPMATPAEQTVREAADAAANAAQQAASEAAERTDTARAERAQAQSLDRVAVTGSRIADAETGGPQRATEIGVHLQPWTPDSPFARRIRGLDADGAYAAYLDERTRAEPGTAFYLDVADVLFDRKRDDLALRVLSNVAEMDLDNRHVLRVLGYRLMQAGRADLAVPVLEQVLAMSDDEPQSYRDLALAYAAIGDRQKAVDLLYEVVAGTWDGRFPGIEVTALAELNALVATSPKPLDTHRVPSDLLRNLPLDLRAVLSWDADNSDMDLWVTDPNGEKAYYAHRDTYQGGHMSRDFTGGYGPEEFALRIAKPGRYKVEANYYGDRQQVVTGATTLQLWLSTRFGTAKQKDQRVTLRLRDDKETVLVGEFEVK
ncbi:VIT domain-containing protein [Cognatilysobacter terrigena]|uniref:VIT domain-containing protein n=1 Tax=Cognatilysobacter terrigena TaxID=2488749 RepID=UPI001FE25319|nr:VIT domain-containing protein [Lysobacter terrigena]